MVWYATKTTIVHIVEKSYRYDTSIRKAVEVLEEGGNTYYYSTKTGEQDITLHHGQRIDGALDAEAMQTFCREHGIRLIVDAAHPFASQLHQTIAQVSELLSIPTIRYERIYPESDPEITWIDDYSQIPRDIHSLLATTGVQSISKLKPLEAEGIRIYYRILLSYPPKGVVDSFSPEARSQLRTALLL